MEKYFKIPTVEYIVDFIYDRAVESYEYGERGYQYKMPYGLSSSFINDVVDRLGERMLDIDVIEYNNNYIVIDWS